MLVHQRLEACDELRVPSECELGLRSLFEDRESQLLQARDLRLGELLVYELGKRLPAPLRKRFAQEPGAARRIGRSRLVEQAPNACEVQLVALDLDQIAGRPGHDRFRAERL